MKLYERKEDAVSPVIGVMLMLVVTVVISAVVVIFATGMAGDSTTTTPLALFEADNQQMNGNKLKSFDLVHKGGDEMNLDNLQVTIEPIGGTNYGITLVRSNVNSEGGGAVTLPPEVANGIEQMKQVPGIDVKIVNKGGDIPLSIRGKTGEDVIVSTGDRIKVIVDSEGKVEIQVSYDGGNSWEPMDMGSGSEITTNTEDDDVSKGVLVKWTLSDIRTTGVIAKGEFVVGA